MLGLRRGIVKLVKYDSNWKAIFDLEAEKLKKIFGKDAIDIQHIGSTAIEGILAKPIIDIGLIVHSFEIVKKYLKELANIGYILKIKDKKEEMFFTNGPEEKRVFYLHIGETGSGFIENSIAFRNFLREHKKTAEEYSKLKEKLADEYSNDRKTYTEKKRKFIEKVLEESGFPLSRE